MRVFFRQRRSWGPLTAAVVLFCFALGFGLSSWWADRAQARLRRDALRELGAIRSHLDARLGAVRIGARSLAEDPVVQRWGVGEAPSDADLQRALDRVCAQFAAEVCYLMDPAGLTVDATNRDQEASFVGSNYGFRPYFQEAMSGTPSTYFALGVTSRKRGYYASHPVLGPEGAVGVAVLKQELDQMETLLFGADEALMLNREGRVLMAADPEPLFQVLDPGALEPGADEQALLEREPQDGGVVPWRGQERLVSRLPLDVAGRELVMFSSMRPVRAVEVAGSIITVLVALVLFVLLVFVRARVVEREHARRVRAIIAAKDRAYRRLFLELTSGLVLLEDPGAGERGLRLVDVNPAGESILGRSSQQLRGVELDELLPAGGELLRERLAELVRTDEPQRFDWSSPDQRLVLDLHAFRSSDDRIVLLLNDDTERARTRRQLREAKEAAEAADLAKSHFLANMSHEIRTPLTGIAGMAELLLLGELDPERRHKVEVILNSSEALRRIITDILDLSKIEAGKLTLEVVDFDLREEVAQVLELLSTRAEAKGLALRLELAESLPRWVQGDVLRLKQVLTNLVGNAIKFTTEGEVAVTVDGQAEGGRVPLRISVADTGIGIPEDLHTRVFEHFTQADSSTTRRFGGSGLGLTITLQLVELRGGSIRVESEPGRGSIFHVELVLALAQAPEHAVEPERQRGPDSLGMRVLVVEDNPVNQDLLEHMLAYLGCEVELAWNGQEAVERIARGGLDAVLMDLQMPILGGIEAAKIARAQGARLPIIALTANALGGVREECLEAGMDAFLTKPLQLRALQEALQTHAQER